MIRRPAVAGSFYPLDKERLNNLLKKCFEGIDQKSENIISAIVPHAGMIYSGKVAAYAYSKIKKSNFIILGTSHSIIGPKFGIMKEGIWATPLGKIEIDKDMSEKLLEKCTLLKYDILSHEQEHSIEIQLPFLQYKFGNDFKFVPINIKSEYPTTEFLEECKIIGKSIAKLIKNKNWIIIASSDFSHYIPKKYAELIDKYIIDSILKLNEKEFFSRLSEKNASVCGFGSIAIAIVASKELGAKKGELLKYSTSAEVTGDERSVVGYGSIIIK